MNDTLKVSLIAIFAIVILVTIGFVIGIKSENQRVKNEAVRAGAAIWVSDESGKPVIKWVTPNKIKE